MNDADRNESTQKPAPRRASREATGTLPLPLPAAAAATLGIQYPAMLPASSDDPATASYGLVTSPDPDAPGAVLCGTLGVEPAAPSQGAAPSAAPRIAVMLWLGKLRKSELCALQARIELHKERRAAELWTGTQDVKGSSAWLYTWLAPQASASSVAEALVDLHALLDTVVGSTAEEEPARLRVQASLRRQGTCVAREEYSMAPGARLRVPMGLRDEPTAEAGHGSDEDGTDAGPGWPPVHRPGHGREGAARPTGEPHGPAGGSPGARRRRGGRVPPWLPGFPGEPTEMPTGPAGPSRRLRKAPDPSRCTPGSLEWMLGVAASIGRFDDSDTTVLLPCGTSAEWFTLRALGVTNPYAQRLPEGTFGMSTQDGYMAYVAPPKGRSKTFTIHSSDGAQDTRGAETLARVCRHMPGARIKVLPLPGVEQPLYRHPERLPPLSIDPSL